jgi:hypothetical protein
LANCSRASSQLQSGWEPLKAGDRKRLNETLRDLQRFGREQKRPATALVIDVDPLTLM